MDTDRLMFFLSQEGFRPTLDERGGVRFNYEGGHYLIRLLPDDPQYVAVAYPNFWQLRSPEEVVRAYRAANLASQAIKVAKIHVLEGAKNVWADAELLVERPEHFDPLFSRTLSILKAAVGHFVDLMRKSEPLPDPRVALSREDVTRWSHGN
jgi:hypothetical protein